MLKYLILAFLAVVISVPFVASYFLPWWGTLLVIIGEVVLLGVGLPALLKYVITKFAKGLFETKSKVLRNAQVEIHACELTTKPERDEFPAPENGDEDSELEGDDSSDLGPKVDRYVLVDCTITPDPRHAGPMTHWDPFDFALAPYGKPMGIEHMDGDTEHDEGSLESVKLTGPDGVEQDDNDFGKIAGPMRLRFIFSCPATLTGRAKLRYYFEGIGDIQLP